MLQRQQILPQFIVTAEEMRQIEERIFAAGMPVPALMEKVAGLITNKIVATYLQGKITLKLGVLVGSGHNGGDALVVARELHLQGYLVKLCCPLSKFKPLTESHYQYALSLGIPSSDQIETLLDCDLIIDGLFGFGLEREITGSLTDLINQLNQAQKLVISIDLPSGIHTDTGAVLGTAIKANSTLCLGLWKRAFLQDQALETIGQASLIDFGIPLTDIQAILGSNPVIQRVTPEFVKTHLPLPRPPVTHKYQQGHLLLICGSRKYAGGAILTALGARASGVGMLSVAVPETLKPLLVAQVPEALIIGCPETDTGAIQSLPADVDLQEYDAIACGPGLTRTATPIIKSVLNHALPLILDADGLNILAELGTISILSQRQALTILTPHTGEFKRLFPKLSNPRLDRIQAVQTAAQQAQATILLKGARTAIATPDGSVTIIPESTPALARGGSGDVLTGLLSGFIATTQPQIALNTVATAAWIHAQAGILASQTRSELGVDAYTLTQFLIPVIQQLVS